MIMVSGKVARICAHCVEAAYCKIFRFLVFDAEVQQYR